MKLLEESMKEPLTTLLKPRNTINTTGTSERMGENICKLCLQDRINKLYISETPTQQPQSNQCQLEIGQGI